MRDLFIHYADILQTLEKINPPLAKGWAIRTLQGFLTLVYDLSRCNVIPDYFIEKYYPENPEEGFQQLRDFLTSLEQYIGKNSRLFKEAFKVLREALDRYSKEHHKLQRSDDWYRYVKHAEEVNFEDADNLPIEELKKRMKWATPLNNEAAGLRIEWESNVLDNSRKLTRIIDRIDRYGDKLFEKTAA